MHKQVSGFPLAYNSQTTDMQLSLLKSSVSTLAVWAQALGLLRLVNSLLTHHYLIYTNLLGSTSTLSSFGSVGGAWYVS